MDLTIIMAEKRKLRRERAPNFLEFLLKLAMFSVAEKKMSVMADSIKDSLKSVND